MAKKLGWTSVVSLQVVLAAAMLAGCAEGPAAGQAGAPVPLKPSSVQFQAVVYETNLAPDKTGAIDAKALTAQAAKPADLQAALAKLGPTRIAYQAYQPVSLSSETLINIGGRRPFVTNTRLTEGGRQINTVQYENFGAVFKLFCEPAKDCPGRMLKIRMNAEMSGMGDSKVEVSKSVTAKTIRQVRANYDGIIEVARPFLLITVDSSSGAEEQAVAYVCRIVLSDLR
jgi:hypothetical protein